MTYLYTYLYNRIKALRDEPRMWILPALNIMLGSAGSSQCKHSSTALVADICICMRALLLPLVVLLSGSDQRPAGRLVRCPTLPIFLSCAPSVRCRHHIRIRSKSKSGPLHPSQSNHPCMQMQCESYRNRSVFSRYIYNLLLRYIDIH